MKRTTILLTGGLGNQLFQYAAGLSRRTDQLQIECHLGVPRTNSRGIPDIFDFTVPASPKPDRRIIPRFFFTKTAGFLIRQGIRPKTLENISFVKTITNLLGSIVLSLWLFSPTKVIQATDNGFFKMPKTYKRELLVGYFQSYVWASEPDVTRILRGIRLNHKSSEFEKFVHSEWEDDIVVLHVRLGDYKNETGFGIPSSDYYTNALGELEKAGGIKKIWLFSNEPELALVFIPRKYLNRVVTVPTFEGSAAETLEAMRLGGRYIIGNSSLSWWGAFLSYTKNPTVIAPCPWFKENADPSRLIPPNWTQLEAWPTEPLV